jgi:hypothetical protein
MSTGEQVTIALLAMAIKDLGIKAKSYTGGQVKVLTDSTFTKARILSIDDANIRATSTKAPWSSWPASRASTRTATSPRWAAAVPTPRRGPGRCAEGRRVPDLHRRRWRLYHRPAHRSRGAQAGYHHLRGNAGNGQPRLQGVADPLGRIRRQVQGQAACALQLRGRRQGNPRARSLRFEEDTKWNNRSFPASPSTATKPSSPSSACPTAPALPTRSWARSPTPTSTWT